MGNWTITGELGAGKTILAVGKIRDFLMDGKKVASNLDLNLAYLLPWNSKATYIRVTDFPETQELLDLGKGGDSPKESTFGLLALDELAMFLNSRSWQKTGRDDFIIFQRHLRKRRWHTLFISQDIDSIDKQARNALIERVVRSGRTDRIKIPVIGSIMQFLGFSGMRAQKHIGYVYYGKSMGPNVKFQDKWTYSGSSLYDAYNTEQEFQPLQEVTHQLSTGETIKYNVGFTREWATYNKQPLKYFNVEIDAPYTVLSAWHIYGRYLNFYDRNITLIRSLTIMFLIIFAGFLFMGTSTKEQTISLPVACKTPDSYIIEKDKKQAIVLYDNQVIEAQIKDGNAHTQTECFKVEL